MNIRIGGSYGYAYEEIIKTKITQYTTLSQIFNGYWQQL